MDYKDPRYTFIKEATRQFMNRHFDSIPTVLFEQALELAHNKGECADDVLELVDTKYRRCPECDETNVAKGKEWDDNEHEWNCPDCEASFDDNGEPWERLQLAEPDHWPGAHGTVFWTTWDSVGKVAAQCGFEVYESPQFNGVILAVDGGGYDFVEAHWMPLYMAMEITWHEDKEGWAEAVKEAKDKGLA